MVLQTISLNGDARQVLFEVAKNGWTPETAGGLLTDEVHQQRYMSTLTSTMQMIDMDMSLKEELEVLE